MQETGERGRLATLDGVRGIAVLLVLVGHAGSNYRIGALGAAGVTLFFGLSGYLITGILRDEYQRKGRIDLRRFYARRMTRLAPPLFVMLAVVSLISWPGWAPLLSASTWTGNYADLLGVNSTPFGHTWSLAVEEQFYLLWPLALGFLLPRGWAVRGAMWLTMIFVLWRTVLEAHGAFIYAYGALETAGSAILAGAVVALARWQLAGRWAVVGAGGLVAVSLWAGAAGGPLWLVVPLLATPFAVLVLAAARSAAWLAWRPLAFCGVASYSLYLWHEPVSYLLGNDLTPVGVAAGALVGLVAYRLIEVPVMRWRTTGSRRPAGSIPAPTATAATLVA